jgi:predicted flap endonuclease-1-like 5' DNA nuclease
MNILEKPLILGVYDDGDKLLHTVQKLRKKGVEIFDCFTPYPVHNLDVEMGISRSNLTVGAFLCGATGFLSGLLLQFYMMTNHLGTFKSWPMIIGGKPMTFKMLPDMVPVTFELTILFTAFGMGILFFAKSKMIHGKIADIMDPRQTDDRLLLAVEPDNINMTRAEFDALLKEEGAIEVRTRNLESEGILQEVEDRIIAEEAPVVESPSVKKAATKPEEKELSSEDRQERLDLLANLVGTADATQKDDLKKISGVGPVYEGKLNDLGIYTYEQVSKLTPEGIRAIEELTKYFPGKIEREDWIGQAKNLMNA